MLDAEGRKTNAAYEAGIAAPEAHGAMTIDDRVGHVFERVDGVLMLDAIRRRPLRYRHWGDMLARVHASVHGGRTAHLPAIKDKLAGQIDRAEGLEDGLRRIARDRLLARPEADHILHGDFHPGNIVLTDGGPVVIDWLDASRGDPAADVARTSWLMSANAIEPGTPNRRLLTVLLAAFRGRYLRRYLRSTGVDREVVREWRLPVLAARLSEGVDHEAAALVGEVRRLARA